MPTIRPKAPMRSKLLLLPFVLAIAGCGVSPPAPSGSVEGAIRLASGRGVQALVRLSGSVERALQADAEGGFSFRHVPAGDYVVAAALEESVDRIGTARVEVRPGMRAQVELRLTGTGSVAGAVRLEPIDPCVAVRVTVAGTALSTLAGMDGSFHLRGVPEGTHALLFTGDGLVPALRAEVVVRHRETTAAGNQVLTRAARVTRSVSGVAHLPGRERHDGIRVRVEGRGASLVRAPRLPHAALQGSRPQKRASKAPPVTRPIFLLRCAAP
jgi:hypothetical protein